MASGEQPRSISPATALELRLRFLEQLLAPPPSSAAPSPARVPLTRHVAALQEQLRAIVDKRANGSDAIKRFVANCESSPHLHLGLSLLLLTQSSPHRRRQRPFTFYRHPLERSRLGGLDRRSESDPRPRSGTRAPHPRKGPARVASPRRTECGRCWSLTWSVPILARCSPRPGPLPEGARR